MKTEIPGGKDCFVTTVTLMALKALGPESLEWEPEILRDAFQGYYGIQRLPQRTFDKLNCGYALVGTNTFTGTIEGFLTCTAVMNNKRFDQSEAPYCTIPMCAWSVWEYMNLLGDMKDAKPTEPFSDDITAYIQEAGKACGITKFPPWLSFADSNPEMPDLTGDVNAFEAYNMRQQDYIGEMNRLVTAKQQQMLAQLAELREKGILG